MPERSAIITEVDSSIGQATALRLLARGWRVGGLGLDHDAMADLEFEGGRSFMAFRGEYDQVAEAFPHVDLFVNISQPRPYNASEAREAWSSTMNEKLMAKLELARALFPRTRTRSAPLVVNVSALMALARPEQASFRAQAEHALEGVARMLSRDLEPRGVEVVNLSITMPGDAEPAAQTIEWLTDRPARVSVTGLSLTRVERAPSPNTRGSSETMLSLTEFELRPWTITSTAPEDEAVPTGTAQVRPDPALEVSPPRDPGLRVVAD